MTNVHDPMSVIPQAGGSPAPNAAVPARPLSSLCLVLALAGCSTTERMAVSSIPMDDYRVRHPIVLAEEPRMLDIFVDPATGQFDRKTVGRLREFAGSYRKFGRGPIAIMPPAGPSGPPPMEPVRHALARAGAHARTIVAPYPASPSLGAPVRLSFMGLKASVAGKCGQWPRDLASGSSITGWNNKPYWNFGCAYQTALAAQVADPRDLVSQQAQTPPDTVMRTRAIEDLRHGEDPTTDWKLPPPTISAVGAY
ncbi:MAG: CpaD family pilus assembly protein [Beijerinckiaceae bacterium]|nr:CpaD family pilus assembly protein [Beijerinckiaceae bacterium]